MAYTAYGFAFKGALAKGLMREEKDIDYLAVCPVHTT